MQPCLLNAVNPTSVNVVPYNFPSHRSICSVSSVYDPVAEPVAFTNAAIEMSFIVGCIHFAMGTARRMCLQRACRDAL